MKFDFGGYATKHNLKCSDGRTITPSAFKEQDGQRVPLVWQHVHNDPGNVLGHAILEYRDDGVYAYCSLNNTTSAQEAKELVQHGDIGSLSIYANKLVQRGGDVIHGMIREVSLVLTGANPGALIDNLSFEHGDTYEVDEESARIFHGDTGENDLDEGAITFDKKPASEEVEPKEDSTPKADDKPVNNHISHADSKENNMANDAGEKTVQDVIDSMSEEQLNVMYYMIGQAVEDAGGSVAQSDFDEDDDYIFHDDMEGADMRNVFENYNEQSSGQLTLSHAEMSEIMTDAKRFGSLKDAVLAHAGTYGIDNIDLLFPDAKAMETSPRFLSRRMEWVKDVLDNTTHSPISRIKSTVADITADEARARGYIKGNLKKEEVIKLLKRTTTPTTIYKKQKLDRDDIIDITDMDVVAWLKAEMRIMLDEEIARAILVGDGRAADSDDKIDEEAIRPIWKEAELYARHVTLGADVTPAALIESVLMERVEYKGSGAPTFYTTSAGLSTMLLLKDKMDRRLYDTDTSLAAAMRVSKVVEIPVLENMTRVNAAGQTVSLLGILVNLKDYTVGSDKGGQVSMFDDFDIDYNQQKYLIETRLSGALTVPASAIVFERLVSQPAV